jgi:predicted CoA-binding protein
MSPRRPSLEDLEAAFDRVLAPAMALGLSEVEALIRRARRPIIAAIVHPRPTFAVAVVGASADRSKFGNKAVRAFRAQGFDVFPVHPHADRIEGLPAFASVEDVPAARLDRVSLYVPPEAGLRVLDQVARKGADEVWLNPGADAPEVVARAEALGLNVIRACSILAVGEHPDHF